MKHDTRLFLAVTHVPILSLEDLTCGECGREHWVCRCFSDLPPYRGSDPQNYPTITKEQRK